LQFWAPLQTLERFAQSDGTAEPENVSPTGFARRLANPGEKSNSLSGTTDRKPVRRAVLIDIDPVIAKPYTDDPDPERPGPEALSSSSLTL